jgi:hypothetical protein
VSVRVPQQKIRCGPAEFAEGCFPGNHSVDPACSEGCISIARIGGFTSNPCRLISVRRYVGPPRPLIIVWSRPGPQAARPDDPA